jgi:hypothetical protein
VHTVTGTCIALSSERLGETRPPLVNVWPGIEVGSIRSSAPCQDADNVLTGKQLLRKNRAVAFHYPTFTGAVNGELVMRLSVSVA